MAYEVQVLYKHNMYYLNNIPKNCITCYIFKNRCVERCQEGTVRAQKFVQSELERFQEQLSRCVLQCQDEVKDKVTPSTSDADIDKYRLEFEHCAIACCDKNIGKLGPLTRRVKETLMSGKY